MITQKIIILVIGITSSSCFSSKCGAEHEEFENEVHEVTRADAERAMKYPEVTDPTDLSCEAVCEVMIYGSPTIEDCSMELDTSLLSEGSDDTGEESAEDLIGTVTCTGSTYEPCE